MATPVNLSGLLQVDGAGNSTTFNAGFTFTAGNDAVFTLSHYNGVNNRVSSITIGGTSASPRVRAASGPITTEIWDAFDISGGTSDVVVNFSAASDNFLSGGVAEYAAADGLAYDTGTSNTASGSSNAPSASTAASTSQNDTVVIATATIYDNASSATYSGPSGWTEIYQETDFNSHVSGRGVCHAETTTGTKTATFGLEATHDWLVAIAAYTVTAAPAGGGIYYWKIG